MVRARHVIVLCLACGCEPSKVVGYGKVDPNVPTPGVYEPIVLRFESDEPPANPFEEYVEFEYWRGLERHKVDGFYDGRDADADWVYKVRFMATEPGDWHYEWRIGDKSDTGHVRVADRRDPRIHGHVRVDKTSPTVLWHDDGTVHHWYGGKSFTALNYRPLSKVAQTGGPAGESALDAYYTDEQVAAYLDLMQDHGLNGTRLKIALYPLENDGVGWDLDWIRRAERWIEMMQQRHIYCQITFFDARSRASTSWSETAEAPEGHLLNAWSDERADEKQNYIRYIVARLAGYWNVYWELVDRIDHAGDEAGDRFVALANEHYLEWLTLYDPNDRAIGASEVPKARMMSRVDIEIPRDPLGLPTADSRRSVLKNEILGTCLDQNNEAKPADADATVRDEAFRLCYRSALWRAFVSGASGASEASWLNLNPPLDPASPVLKVMRDHGRLRTIVEGLETGLDELVNDPGFVVTMDENQVVTMPEHQGTRAKLGHEYLAYFAPGKPAGKVDVRLPKGRYQYHWFDPEVADRGDMPPISEPPPPEQPKTIRVEASPTSLDRPAYDDDLVLVVRRLSDEER